MLDWISNPEWLFAIALLRRFGMIKIDVHLHR